jgi:predicted DNA-binding transcriptional regulator AlpA
MTQEVETDELLTREEVLQRTRLPSATFYRLRERGGFPAPVTFGRARSDGRPVSTAWRASVVDAWLADRKVSTPEADSIIQAPTGARIEVRPAFNRLADAEVFARAVGGCVWSQDLRRHVVWINHSGVRAERVAVTLHRDHPWASFDIVTAA